MIDPRASSTDEGMTFDKWLRQVDGVIGGLVGLSYNDLADQTWYDWYEGNMTAEEAAYECLENEGMSELIP